MEPGADWNIKSSSSSTLLQGCSEFTEIPLVTMKEKDNKSSIYPPSITDSIIKQRMWNCHTGQFNEGYVLDTSESLVHDIGAEYPISTDSNTFSMIDTPSNFTVQPHNSCTVPLEAASSRIFMKPRHNNPIIEKIISKAVLAQGRQHPLFLNNDKDLSCEKEQIKVNKNVSISTFKK